MSFRGELQAPQPGKGDALWPGQHGPALAATERLLTGPQGFPVAARARQQEALQAQAMRVQ